VTFYFKHEHVYLPCKDSTSFKGIFGQKTRQSSLLNS